MFEPDGDDIVGIAAAGFDEQIEGLRMPSKRSPHGLLALRTKQPVAIDDALNDSRVERDLMVEYGIKSVLVIPLLLREEPVGVLYFNYHSRSTHFSPAQIDFASKLAASLALALENARLFEDERQARAEADADRARLREEASRTKSLLDAANTLGESTDVHTVLAQLAENIMNTTGRKRVWARLYEPKTHLFRTVLSVGSEKGPAVGDEIRLEDMAAPAQETFVQRRALVSDIDALPPEKRGPFAAKLGLRCFVSAPMYHGDTPLGAIGVDDPDEHHEFTDDEISLIEAIIAQAAVAVDNARLFEAERRHAEISEALSDVSTMLSSTFDVDQVMPSVLERLGDAAGASGMSVAMRDADTWLVTHGIGIQAKLVGSRWDPASVPSQEDAVTTRQPVVVQDVLESDRVNRSVAKELGYRSFGIYPLTVRGQAIGSVTITFTEPRRLDASTMTFMSRAEYVISLAIENARLYEAEHNIAETLQETLVVLPFHLPEIAFSRAYESATSEAGRVGGDFVDLFELRGHTTGIVIGDVSGKGMDAAVITSLVRNTIRAHAIDGLPPNVVVEKTNNVMRRFTEVDAYVTLFFGLLNTRSGLLRYVSAGHPPALVFSEGELSQELTGRNPIVGAFEDAQFNESQAVLRCGERLVVYTDGVIEARSPDGNEFFDIDGLKRSLHQHGRDDDGEARRRRHRRRQGVQQRCPP